MALLHHVNILLIITVYEYCIITLHHYFEMTEAEEGDYCDIRKEQFDS